MIQRIALLVGGLGAAAVLAFALGLTNFVFAGPGALQQTAAQLSDASVAPADNTPTADSGQNANSPTQTKKVVDKVYIAPAPPKVIRVPQPQANTPQTNTPKSHATPPPPPPNNPPAAAPRGNDDGGYDDGHDGRESEHDGGHERGDD